MGSRPLILGLSCSLRNARSTTGAQALVGEIEALGDRAALDAFLAAQAKEHLDAFLAAGRADGLPFDELYRQLKKSGGLRGLSNSEIGLSAALWAAHDLGCDIEHVSLADHFPADGETRDLDALKDRLRAADGLLVATPVYFGDRSSLAQRLVEIMADDDALKADMRGKVYGGISVGAKRNGGQETTLIYQMMDMVNLGLLGVGNDSDTTSQYGGTIKAGDVGTGAADDYGLNTSIGTGRRVAKVVAELAEGARFDLADTAQVGVWVLQDRAGELMAALEPLLGETARFDPIHLIDDAIRPCIACDICPTHVGVDAEYRCIIKRKANGLVERHDDLLAADILMPALLAPKDRTGLSTVYQQFMERTRYIRRGDYALTDRLVAPVVVADVGVNDHMDMRMLTSFIRHHTVMHKPIVAWRHEGRILNADQVAADIASAVGHGVRLLKGRLSLEHRDPGTMQYHPVGYVLASAKDNEETTIDARERAVEERRRLISEQAARRLATR